MTCFLITLYKIEVCTHIYRDGDMLSHDDTFRVLFRRRGQGIVRLTLLAGNHNVSEVNRDGAYLKIIRCRFCM